MAQETKATTTAAAGDASSPPRAEPAGLITSDSLAAESAGFLAGNPRAGVSKQPSRSTTSNVTDTSAARVLAPAVDAEARRAEEEWDESKMLDAGRSGSGGGGGAAAGGARRGRDGSGTLDPGPGGRGAVKVGVGLGRGGKKGEEEEGNGGFDGPNASMGDVDVGSKDDPGRLAEEKFERQNAQFDGGHGARDRGIEAETGRFDALKDDVQS